MTVQEFALGATEALENLTPKEKFVSGMLYCFLQWIGAFTAMVLLFAVFGTVGLREFKLIGAMAIVAALVGWVIWRSIVFHDSSSPALKKAFQVRIGMFLLQVFRPDMKVVAGPEEQAVVLPDGASIAVSYGKDVMINMPLIVAGGPVGIPSKGVHQRTFFFDIKGKTDLLAGRQYCFEINGRKQSNRPDEKVTVIEYGDRAGCTGSSDCRKFVDRLRSLVSEFPIYGRLMLDNGRFHLRLYDLVRAVDPNGTILYGGMSKKAVNRWKQKGVNQEVLSCHGVDNLLTMLVNGGGWK